MAIMRSNPRSSDSIDFEHTATIKDMEELLLAETEYGGLDGEPAVRDRLAADLSFSFPNFAARRPAHDVVKRKSRSSSQASPNSNVNEKIAVYKDTDVEPGSNATSRADTSKLATPCTHTKGSQMTLNSAVDDRKNYTKVHLSIYEDAAFYRDSSACMYNSVVDTSTFVQQLRDIAFKRSSLLLQLKELQNEEQNILESLNQAASRTRNASSRRSSLSIPPPLPPLAPSSTRPLNAPRLPRPILLPSRLPRVQPTKTSTKPLHTRTVSAPTLSTPVGAQRLAPRLGKRVPLGYKTPIEVKTDEREGLGVGSAPIADAMGLSKGSGHVIVDEERGFAGRKQARKAAMQFGEDGDEAMGWEHIGAGNSTELGRACGGGVASQGTRDRSKSKGKSSSRNRSRSRGRTTVATPGLGGAYKVQGQLGGRNGTFEVVWP
ncbi:hypothetical protein BKA63DRAFT_576637 [Paraphoma chrysanthemicola]|nr:hypothetical protein BKA63DRAFT_576637 [Paraphoma chrysanthemicola]